MRRAHVVVAVLAAAAVACGGGGGGGSSTTTARGPVATAVGTPLEVGATATIPASGGGTYVSSDGRLEVTFPNGAFDPGTVLTIQRITNTAPGGNGVAYRVLPSRTFSSPATLTFDASGIGSADAGGMGVAYQTASRQWSWIPDGLLRDTGANRVSVTTTHLTDFSLVSSILLQPLSATVGQGETVQLEVAACFEPDSNGSLASLLAWECSDALAPVGVALEPGSWSVNGVAGGNATFGTVVGSGLQAIYHAPAAVPDPSTVAVTVKTQAMPGRPQATLYSLVTIRSSNLTGSISGTGTFGLWGPVSFSMANATLTRVDDGPDETNYDLTGTVTVPASFTSGASTCTVVETSYSVPPTNFKVLKSPAAVRFAFIAEFPINCTGFGDTVLYVQYGTFTPGCASSPLLVNAPIPDTQHVEGTYATQCPATTVVPDGTWAFQ